MQAGASFDGQLPFLVSGLSGKNKYCCVVVLLVHRPCLLVATKLQNLAISIASVHENVKKSREKK